MEVTWSSGLGPRAAGTSRAPSSALRATEGKGTTEGGQKTTDDRGRTTKGAQHSSIPAFQHSVPVIVRLVHGYNMPDCMKLKEYEVSLLRDIRRAEADGSRVQGFPPAPYVATEGKQGFKGGGELGVQVWKLKSVTDDVSVWVTTMIRAGDFEGTDVDIRSMAFPRVGARVEPNWVPRGVTWKSLRHPVANFRKFMAKKWDNSRCDLWTFLKLRQPAWASEELLTLVSASAVGHVRADDEARVGVEVVAAHEFVHNELHAWKAKQLEAAR